MDFIALQAALAGQYFLERELGRGGMGVVYLARELRLDRPVAIKVLPPALARQPVLRERFLREARTAAGLAHPNVVPVYRVDEAGEFVFLVMGYVDGGTVGDRLRERGTLPAEDVVRVVRDVAWALAYAHGRGVVHRDVKPDNILLDRASKRALVTDFGIALPTDAGADGRPLTGEGLVMGTAHYMSPEQAAGEPLDGRSDLYALGVVAYQALAGRPPFDAPSVPALLAKHLTQPPPPIDGAPPRLARVVLQCLAKHRDARPATGEALADLIAEATPVERPLPVPLRLWAESRDPLTPVYAVLSGIPLMVVVLTVVARAAGTRPPGSDSVLKPLLLALLPAAAAALYHLVQVARPVRAGYGIADLRLALRTHLERRHAEAEHETSALAPWLMRVLRTVAYGSIVALAMMIVWMVGDPAFHGGARTPERMAAVRSRNATFNSLLWFTLAANVLGSALGASWPGRAGRGALDKFRQRFWESRAGEVVVSGLRRWRGGARPPQHVERPTEHVIGLAAGELFAALPEPTRRALGELPELVASLERRAEAERVRAAALASRADAVDAGAPRVASGERDAVRRELAEARAAAERRRDHAIGALESIRLDLLRMQAGVAEGTALTALVERVRGVEQRIDGLLDVGATAGAPGAADARAPRVGSPPAGSPVA